VFAIVGDVESVKKTIA